MGTPAGTSGVLYRGDLVRVKQVEYPGEQPRPERLLFVHTTMRHGDEQVELCDNPYRPDPREIDYFSFSVLELVRRGNWFRARHNMPLLFDEPADELLFWRYYAGVSEVPNPLARGNCWTRQQALNALSAKTADLFVFKGGVYKGYRFKGGVLAQDKLQQLRMLNQATLRAAT